MLLYQTLLVRWNENATETFRKAVSSLQRCFNRKTPLLHFWLWMFILLFCFNHVSLKRFCLTEQEHHCLPITRFQNADSPMKKKWPLQKTLHYFNHNLSFSRHHWLKRQPPGMFLSPTLFYQRAHINKKAFYLKSELFNKANYHKTNAIAISSCFNHFIQNPSTFQTLKILC